MCQKKLFFLLLLFKDFPCKLLYGDPLTGIDVRGGMKIDSDISTLAPWFVGMLRKFLDWQFDLMKRHQCIGEMVTTISNLERYD